MSRGSVYMTVLVGIKITQEDFFTEPRSIPEVCDCKGTPSEGLKFCGECGRPANDTQDGWDFKFPQFEKHGGVDTQGLDKEGADEFWGDWSDTNLICIYDFGAVTTYYLGVLLYASGDLLEGQPNKSSPWSQVNTARDRANDLLVKFGFAGRFLDVHYCPWVGDLGPKPKQEKASRTALLTMMTWVESGEYVRDLPLCLEHRAYFDKFLKAHIGMWGPRPRKGKLKRSWWDDAVRVEVAQDSACDVGGPQKTWEVGETFDCSYCKAPIILEEGPAKAVNARIRRFIPGQFCSDECGKIWNYR